MLRRDLLRSLLATPLAGRFRSWIPSAFGGGAVPGPDASTIYRRVFGWSDGLPPEDSQRLLKAASIAIDDPAVDALIDRAGPALAAIREAAAIDRCDWGVEILSGSDLGKGHLDISTVHVIRAACLSARRHARRGRGRAALDDVFAGLTLAHRIGTGGVLIARVLECGGEVPAFQTLGRILPGLDPATLDDLSRRLDVLPPPEPASATIGPESRFIVATLRAKLLAGGPKLAGDDWDEVGFGPEQAEVLGRLTGGDRAALLAHLAGSGPGFAELARRLDLPRPGCRAALEEFARSGRLDYPLAATLTESVWGVRHMADRMRALRAMLRAGLALVRDGEPAFRAVADPFGSGPFGLVRRDGDCLIRSALRDEGSPEVTLGVGDPT